ncbi:hypothetical protein RD110_09515 [Rhodoferax koreense]|uniref:Phosphatidic acid phosphatase type 2/haloperoxidase domain-containing protein n=1 Tax=Rhodoferax koreensis TaxID=1842727 RepID=A0A1P8JUF3_9BURK|nr:phosphatase PAP2 family protein [Rhodoferax koreense]APW37396.1 hypothetical protein RD110_09515 [Rhodoferax koreense]
MLLPYSEYRWLTRFGEIGILWPVAIALALWMLFVGRSWRLALAWLLPLGVAVFITSVSKIAFIGWGVGIRALDFTGVSGHAMFSAAIYPVMAFALTASARPERRRWQLLAVAAAYAFALLIAYSRVVVHAHSWSEVVAGFVLGAAASGCTLWLAGRPAGRPWLRWALVAVACWFALMPGYAAPTNAHDLVTELSLRLAGRDRPFLREDLHAGQPS